MEPDSRQCARHRGQGDRKPDRHDLIGGDAHPLLASRGRAARASETAVDKGAAGFRTPDRWRKDQKANTDEMTKAICDVSENASEQYARKGGKGNL